MMEGILNYVITYPFLVALLTTALVTPLCIKLLKKYGIVDDPKRNHPGIIHKKPIPRGGGIPLFLGTLVAGILFLPLNSTIGAIFLAAFIALVVGVLDDKYDLSPYLRFGTNIICAVIIVAAGISVNFITNPAGGILYLNEFRLPIEFLGINAAIVLSDIVAILWIIWVMNMLNWSKGVDGQMPGIVAISAFFIGLLSLRFGSLDITTQASATLSFIIMGVAIGFLFL